MSDLDYSVAEEHIVQKERVRAQQRKKLSDRLKHERAKDRIRMPEKTKQAFDLRRVKSLADLPEE